MILTSNIGFPRIGPKRELKKAIESYWKSKISIDELCKSVEDIKKENYAIQKKNGIDLIPSNDFTLYDSVLDHAVMFNQIPQRYLKFGDANSLDVYFAMARGKDDTPALEMTKWFDTNYHYIVPEITDHFSLTENRALKEYKWALESLKIKTKPVILGPYTFLKLAKIKDEKMFIEKLNELAIVYKQLISDLIEEGIEYIQIDEPYLIYGEDKDIIKTLGKIYSDILQEKGNSKFILQTYFENINEHLEEAVRWPFDYLGLDLIRGEDSLKEIKKISCPRDKKLALGIIDGRNIWKSNPLKSYEILKEVAEANLLENAIIQPSCSLMHCPYSLEYETAIDEKIKKSMSFAVEKINELSKIKKMIPETCKIKDFKSPKSFAPSFQKNERVIKKIKSVKEEDFKRKKGFSERSLLQKRFFNLPDLPTTTIGSFPQTPELRKTRAKYKSKKIPASEYREYIKKEISNVIKLQEDIGLDVLVHGEFERTDMVEFFGEKLEGFLFTKNGWVQSYGTRCVKPPVIYGDVERKCAMTVEKIVYAQSLTKKPVKGMLTGPVTILNWSFPRNDLNREEIAYQIALSLRDEAVDLEKNGINIIQIDEPAIREGLPIKKSKQENYLNWAVKAFRLSSSGVKDSTQIHTHMCYSDFNEIIRNIYDMDADVISIENARSSDEILSIFREFNYDHHIGPGVYDIHSPRVPSVNELESKIKKVSNHIKKDLLWINPDCGLKTRDYPETIESLKNMVAAAKSCREKL